MAGDAGSEPTPRLTLATRFRGATLPCTMRRSATRGLRPRRNSRSQRADIFLVGSDASVRGPALTCTTRRCANRPQHQPAPHSRWDGLESDELLRMSGRLSDEQREALILTLATGLSHEQADEVCDCHIEGIKSRVSEAWREISRMEREASHALIHSTDGCGRTRTSGRLGASCRLAIRRPLRWLCLRRVPGPALHDPRMIARFEYYRTRRSAPVVYDAAPMTDVLGHVAQATVFYLQSPR